MAGASRRMNSSMSPGLPPGPEPGAGRAAAADADRGGDGVEGGDRVLLGVEVQVEGLAVVVGQQLPQRRLVNDDGAEGGGDGGGELEGDEGAEAGAEDRGRARSEIGDQAAGVIGVQREAGRVAARPGR